MSFLSSIVEPFLGKTLSIVHHVYLECLNIALGVVFNLELNEGLEQSFHTLRDADPFDEICHHLLVEDIVSGEVVGTYRLQTGERASRGLGYYSAQEFDFSPLEPIRSHVVELGRACVAKPHRNLAVLEKVPLPVDDRLRYAKYGLESLLHVLDQPLGLLQLAAQAGGGAAPVLPQQLGVEPSGLVLRSRKRKSSSKSRLLIAATVGQAEFSLPLFRRIPNCGSGAAYSYSD